MRHIKITNNSGKEMVVVEKVNSDFTTRKDVPEWKEIEIPVSSYFLTAVSEDSNDYEKLVVEIKFHKVKKIRFKDK